MNKIETNLKKCNICFIFYLQYLKLSKMLNNNTVCDIQIIKDTGVIVQEELEG